MNRENFIRTTQPTYMQDGDVSLHITTANGRYIDIDTSVDGLADLIGELLSIAQTAAVSKTGGIPTSMGKRPPNTRLSDIRATQLAIAEGAGQLRELNLFVRISDFDLAFRVGRSTLRQFRSALDEAKLSLNQQGLL